MYIYFKYYLLIFHLPLLEKVQCKTFLCDICFIRLYFISEEDKSEKKTTFLLVSFEFVPNSE